MGQQTTGAQETRKVTPAPLLTVTMEKGGAVCEAPRAVWLGRVAAIMEARGDRDEAVRLYGQASAELLTGNRPNYDEQQHRQRVASINRDGSISASDAVAAPGGGGAGRCRTGEGGPGRQGSRDEMGQKDNVDLVGLFPYSSRAHSLASCIARAYRRHFRR